MNNRILIAAVLQLSALVAPTQNVGAAVAYTNSLTNASNVVSDFLSYTTVDSDYINNPDGGWFVVDNNYGLELLSTLPNYVEGLATYNSPLQASKDWTITIQSHISAFTNNQTNPYYSAGLCLIKTSTNGLEYPNRLELNLCRTGIGGTSLKNRIVSSMFINNGEAVSVANNNLTDVYLRLKYDALTRRVGSYYSTNGSNFTLIGINNLGIEWRIRNTDELTLGLAANDQPDGRVIPNYSVFPGQMYLKNLTISSPNAPSNSTQGGVSGGSFSGSLSMGNGGANSMYNGAVTIFGGNLVFNTNPFNPPQTNSNNSNTNIIGGGGGNNGGSLSFTNTNSGGGTTNTNSGGPGGGLPGGAPVFH
jgi:hypothetical protein